MARIELLMPFLAAELDELEVDSWMVEEGESFGYGDVLCELVVTTRALLERDRVPRRMFRSRFGRRSDVRRSISIQRGHPRIRVMSAERAALQEIVAAPGTRVRTGDLLARVQADGEGEAGQLRAVAEFVTGQDADL